MASHDFPVAVIGMAVKLPGADNCNEFWELMVNRGDTVSTFPPERAADVEHVLPAFKGQFVDENNPFFTGSFFKSVDHFDAGLFGVNPKEALFIEPEQRMFLEAVWELLEDAGYASKIRNTNTGVYVGNTVNKYKYILTENHPSISHGNHSPFISSRVSYTFNLSGPAMMVATGCSSSLLAVHLACQGLLSGDCDMAIAGGITLDLLPISLKTDIWNQLGITSQHARCRAFDANAKGIAKAEGCGIVLLKPLNKAIADGDHIYGVLEATTANQDGHSQGITAPHPGAQSNLLTKAWELAGITPESIGYIEAHGTGTELGDPIEIMGIAKAYQKMAKETSSKNEKIPIGSVKANIGHLADGAAGVVSLIKVLLCLNKKYIPPVTNFSSPNPHINWEKAPVVVNEELRRWENNGSQSRYGGVSAFGLLGTNIHAVVKDYKPKSIIHREVDSCTPTLLCLAAKTKESLDTFIARLLDFVEKHSEMTQGELSSICQTLNSGREQQRFHHRLVIVSNNPTDLLRALRTYIEDMCTSLEQREQKSIIRAVPTKEQASIIDYFLKGHVIDWKKFYKTPCEFVKVPVGMLPTYAFEKTRYWPEVARTLNRQYLILEHQIPVAIEEHIETLQTPIDTDARHKSNGNSTVYVFDVLSGAFNKALGNSYDWVKEGDTNLFDLGVDSLVYTHLAMRLLQVFDSKIMFTQGDLHSRPSFNELWRFLQDKIHTNQRSGHAVLPTSSNRTNEKHDTNDMSDIIPLSFSQRRLWVIEKIEKAGSTYNATNCLKIKGDLDVDAFKKSVNTALKRHDAFFISIQEINAEPCIVYNWEAHVEVEEIDMSSFNSCPEETAMKAYNTDYKTPFNLVEGPLVRVSLYRIDSDHHVFTMVIHHIIFDGWSHFVFYNEVWNNYRMCIAGQPLSNEIQTPMSSMFSKLERKESLITQSKMQTDIEFWIHKLSSPLPLSTFPGDRKRPQTFTFEGGRLTRFIDMSIFKNLNSCVSNSHTMFHSILASVFVLLQYFNPAQTDFVVGIPVTGRHMLEMRDVIGCFINTLVIRIAMGKPLSYSDILQSVVKTCLEAQEHHLAPFDHLVSKLKLTRNTSITPVFSVNVCYHNVELQQGHVDPPNTLEIERKLLHNGTSKWDVQFDFLEEGEQMRFTLEYYKGIFSDNYAQLIADMLVQTMEMMTKAPDVPLLSSRFGEASIMVGPHVYIGARSLADILDESIENHPDSVIKDVTGQLHTYKTLKGDSVQLANFFTNSCRLAKGDRVGLLFENSYEGLSVIVACLMTGIVYVPLNPDNPKARLEQIVRGSRIKMICFSKETFSMASYLQWSCEEMRNIFCINGRYLKDVTETQENPLMDTELWNCVADGSTSDIEGGGWKSSFTGEHMTIAEMKDYVNNVVHKLEKHIGPETTILEIGCASGLTTQALCSKVKSYVATDLSEVMVEKLRVKNLEHVQTQCVPAHEIGKSFKDCTFDLIIINSVVHCFPGYNYLRKVLQMSANLLTSHGKIFVGDVMDLKKRDELEHALKSFKASNPNCRTKTDLSAELFLPKEFFESFVKSFPTVVCSPKLGVVENELTKYRYDVLMTKEALHMSRKQTTEKLILSVNDIEPVQECQCIASVNPDDDAYILFTSGTTGTPKGVRISQKALLNYCSWAASAYCLNTTSNIPLFSPLTFDFTVTSIIPPLLQGSTIEIFKPFADSYEDLATSTSLTVAKFSPLQLETVLASATAPLSMKTYILGGEEVTYALLKKLKDNKQNNPFKVWNEYGPTEATVGCVIRCIDSAEIEELEEQNIPIGRPINNVTVAVVDDGNPVTLGSKGYLAIGGSCLTSGFLHSGSDTTDVFTSACWSRDGSLMYTTTDIVSCSVDKEQIYYFGRDNTDITKINEIRVDISEVQSSIRKVAFVEDAWACRFEKGGSAFIGAAIKLKQSTKYKDEDLKHAITKELTYILPVYCIPKVVVQLTDPPTNTNGKKDTVLLRRIFANALEMSTERDDCQPNAVEKQVQKIWQEILPINRIPGLNEDFFFELSGDSLQAIHLVRKLRSAGFSLTVNDVFRKPTIKSLCTSLQTNMVRTIQSKSNSERNEPFRPTPIAERYMLTKRESDRYAVPALLELRSSLNVEVIRKALQAVMTKHRSLSSRFFIENGQVFQQYIDVGDKPAVFEANLSRNSKNVVEDPVFTEACNNLEHKLDIGNGTLLNAAVFRSDLNNYCLIVVHHITVDIVSWQQLLEDLSIALGQANSGNLPILSPASVPFDVYCAELWKEGKTCPNEEIEYWKDVTQTYKTEKAEVSLYGTAKWESQSVDADTVRQLSIAIGGTDESVILTALGQSFSKLQGKSLTVCLESHGRQIHLDTTDTVGWCTSMFPFTIHTKAEDDFVIATRKVKDDIKQIPLHGVRYGPAVGVGRVESDLPNTMFVFQGSLDASSKVEFEAGDASFKYLPWVEVMTYDLENGHYHRDDNDLLNFPLGVICWFHSNNLRIGSLFDSKKVSSEWVQMLLKGMKNTILAESKKERSHAYDRKPLLQKDSVVPNQLEQREAFSQKPKDSSISVQIISNVTIVPEVLSTTKHVVLGQGIEDTEILLKGPHEFYQCLLQEHPSPHALTIAIIRCGHSNEREDIEEALNSFSKQNQLTGNKLVVLGLDNIPNSISLKFDKKANFKITPLQFEEEACDANSANFDIPLTRQGYTMLAVAIAREISACLTTTSVKVICVDGDYTLWGGECANNDVVITQANTYFQNFLLQKMHEGYLLVLISKNRLDDVLALLDKNEMILKKEHFVHLAVNWQPKHSNISYVSKLLKLDLQSFVFIDDNVTECEEMLKVHPQVRTLRFPTDSNLTKAFTSSLWLLDKIDVTHESANRTEMYRSEVSRLAGSETPQNGDGEVDHVTDLLSLLRKWDMEIKIWRSSMRHLSFDPNVSKRVAELLHRTNQFKLNATHTTLGDFSDEDECVIASLEDGYGKYGIISVVIIRHELNTETVKQWVISCRALGRNVEERLLYEISKHTIGNDKQMHFQFEKTSKNIPMQSLIQEFAIHSGNPTEDIMIDKDIVSKINRNLDIHEVNVTSDPSIMLLPAVQLEDNLRQFHNPVVSTTVTNLKNLSRWMHTNLSKGHKDHVSRNNMLPLFLLSDDIGLLEETNKNNEDGIIDTLEEIWMRILKTHQSPSHLDNFVKQGGSSFQAVFLISEIMATFCIKVELIDVLTKPFSWLNEYIQRSDSPNKTDHKDGGYSDTIELTQAQKRMWMLQRSSEGSTAYTETIALMATMTRPFGEIVSDLINRHPLLLATLDRTASYLHLDGDKENVEERDFKSYDDLISYISTSKSVFDKTGEPLSKFMHLKCEVSVIVIHVHHLLVDDITLHNMKISLRQLMQTPDTKSEKKIKLNDQVRCFDILEAQLKLEKEYLRSTDFENDRLFWEQKFVDCPEETSLSLNSVDLNEFVPKTADISTVCITNDVVQQMQDICSEYGVTGFQYILACFLLVVQRYTGKEEVLLAVPVSSRPADIMDTDGLFVNTVLFRYKIRMEQTFVDHIKCVAEEWMESFSHSMYPINCVSQKIRERFGTSMQSICNVMFNFSTFEKEEDDVDVKSKHTKMPFSIDAVKDKKGYTFVCEYAEDLICCQTVNNILGSLANVLSHGKVCRNLQIRTIEFLTDHELKTIDSFSVSSTEIERSVHVFEMFLKNVESGPENTAVCFKRSYTSYRVLKELLETIAVQILHKTDVITLRQKPVIIYMDKSVRAIAAMFAVWKLGGFFMPLSTIYTSNIDDVIESVQPCIVLVDQTLITHSSLDQNCNIININDADLDVSTESSKCLNIQMCTDRPAYMIRTSGSTGKPKHILVSHKGLAVVASAWKAEYNMSQFQVSLLQWAPLSFDVFIGDIVRGLCCSKGKVVICPDTMRLDTDYIISLIVEEEISIAEVTPQFGLLLTQRAVNKELDSLRVFILGSDTLQKEVYNKIKRCLGPQQRLLNSYGMTEATIDSSFFEGGEMPLTRGGVIPVGKPLPGVELKVLDQCSLRPCPVGVVGDLYIGGDTVGSGEVNIIEMENGEKLLKTNDYACWLHSGDLELCGRKDTMCKLRGFRIDGAYIENTILRNCDHVLDVSVVVLKETKNGQENEYLCAFIVKSLDINDTTVLHRLIKNKLCDILPYYMVPDFIEIVHEIPLSQNGKVDCKRLPALHELLGNRLTDYKENQVDSPVANELKDLFSEALGVTSAHIDDGLTFMEQGGHSLVLMKFYSLIKERSHLKISIVDIFSYPSIKLLTERASRTSKVFEINPTFGQKDDSPQADQEMCDIAICGVGLRLPHDTRSISDFWELLENHTNLVSSFPEHRKNDVFDCSDPDLSNSFRESGEFQGAFLTEIDKFDDRAFAISSTEAQSMAPEQRKFLEVASETLAQGTDISQVNGSNIGVFLSQTEIGYAKLNHAGDATAISGLMPGMIATRVAYHFNLKGPTMLVDTACSSGISALKAACNSIQKGECKSALVGGMNIVLYPSRTGVHGTSGIMSPDFVCRPFDKNANGTSVGEGIICFYVEPLQNALTQNKHVYGVIKSIGTNSVGKGNGITAPTVNSQKDVIRKALNEANISPKDVSFIEAHGTGTVLGDKIELAALTTVFNSQDMDRKIPVGSVKGNLGHLDYAAGLAGLLKIISGYLFRTIPPTANFIDSHKELSESALYVPTKPEPWQTPNKLRFAGLSSFGLTGTNTHTIVSDVISSAKPPASLETVPLLLCGASHGHIRRQAALYETLVRQTVVKHNINTVQEISTSIAIKLQQLQKSKLLNTNHRVAILDCNTEKLLRSLNFISNCEDETQLRNPTNENCAGILSACIDFIPEGANGETELTEGVNIFLTSSVINTVSLFGDTNVNSMFCAPGVPLSVFDSKRHWLRPCMKIPQSGLGLMDIIHGKISKTRELVRTLNLTPPADLLQYEARFCCSIILNLLKETELREAIENQSDITIQESFAKTGMMEKYDKLFFIMIRELFNLNMVKARGSDSKRLNLDVYSFRCRDMVLPSPKHIAEEAMTKHPQWADCFRFPLHCSKHLKQVLWGHLSPLSVIYPQGDLNFMYQFNKLGDLLGDVYYNMYMQMIVEYTARLSSKGKTVRILEVGAGMGHVTRQLLPSLSGIPNVEYWFTDLGRAFVENAKTLFENYTSMMRFSTFDITKNAVKQGLLGTYDIVISYNVIHTTESIYLSVNNLKTCIGEDGTLFIIESAKNETWATLAWGILDGWWYFKDYDLRPYEPMLEPEKWEEVLKKSGFDSITSCPMDPEERKHVEKFLFVCSKKQTRAEYIPAPSDGWWKCIDLTAHRHADFDTNSSCSDESGLGDEGNVSKSSVKAELKRIWCELLDLEDIDEDEDFNALGGESLLAIQMMTMVRKRIGFQLEIADTFCYTSLGSLGDYISDQLEVEASQQSNTDSSTNSSDNEIQIQSTLPSPVQQSTGDVPGCLLMFPGQGSQKVGMCKSMKDSDPAKHIFKQAEGIIGYNILDICTGPVDILTEKLQSTEFVQVALFVSCLAKISQLQCEQPEVLQSVTHVAGLSVGEFAAMVYAKVLRFEDALVLVQRRGRAMEKEVAKASTAMASVLGTPKEALELFLKEHLPQAVISTCLADNQHTVAGTEPDIERLIRLLLDDKNDRLNVIDVRRLRVAGAFHSAYMNEAENEIKPLIDECLFRKPEVPIIMNVTGETCDDPAAIKTLISRQIVENVRWKDTMVTAHTAGVRKFIEIAPARVLSSIVRTRIEKCKGCTGELIQV